MQNDDPSTGLPTTGGVQLDSVLTLQEEMVARHCPVCGSADESSVFAEANFDLARLDAFAFASRKVPEHMHYRLVACPIYICL